MNLFEYIYPRFYFDKARLSGMSNSQLYKQAGNGIVVNVFEAILRELIK